MNFYLGKSLAEIVTEKVGQEKKVVKLDPARCHRARGCARFGSHPVYLALAVDIFIQESSMKLSWKTQAKVGMDL